MFGSRIWTMAVVAMVGATLLLTPGTSEAQRRGGRGGWSGGGRDGEGGWNRGGWGYGFGAGLGLGYGLGGVPYYGGRYYGGNYGYGYSPEYYDSGSYVYPDTQYVVPQTSYYPADTYTQGAAQQQQSDPNAAGIVVRVPDPNAEVWFDTYKTQQRGTVRQFSTESLDPNQNYTYHLRARWMQNGQQMEQTRDVSVRPGQNVTVDFTSGNQNNNQNRVQTNSNQNQPNQFNQNQNQQNRNQQVTPNQQNQNRQDNVPQNRNVQPSQQQNRDQENPGQGNQLPNRQPNP